MDRVKRDKLNTKRRRLKNVCKVSQKNVITVWAVTNPLLGDSKLVETFSQGHWVLTEMCTTDAILILVSLVDHILGELVGLTIYSHFVSGTILSNSWTFTIHMDSELGSKEGKGLCKHRNKVAVRFQTRVCSSIYIRTTDQFRQSVSLGLLTWTYCSSKSISRSKTVQESCFIRLTICFPLPSELGKSRTNMIQPVSIAFSDYRTWGKAAIDLEVRRDT